MRTVTMMSGPAIRQIKNENARLRDARVRLTRLVKACRALHPMFEWSDEMAEVYTMEIRNFEMALAWASEIVSSTSRSESSTSRSVE